MVTFVDRLRYFVSLLVGLRDHDFRAAGTGVAFNATRCICHRILGNSEEPDDYPEAYIKPSRLLDPKNHLWPNLETDGITS